MTVHECHAMRARDDSPRIEWNGAEWEYAKLIYSGFHVGGEPYVVRIVTERGIKFCPLCGEKLA